MDMLDGYSQPPFGISFLIKFKRPFCKQTEICKVSTDIKLQVGNIKSLYHGSVADPDRVRGFA